LERGRGDRSRVGDEGGVGEGIRVEGVAIGGRARGSGGVGEDVVLGAISKTVCVVVGGCALGVSGVLDVVSLIVSPVERVLDWGAHFCGISKLGEEVAWGLAITTHGRDRLANHALGGVGDVALECCHIHLVSATDGIVDPKPRACIFRWGMQGGRECRKSAAGVRCNHARQT